MKKFVVIERIFGNCPESEFIRSIWETEEEAKAEAKRLTCLYEESKKKHPGGPMVWFRVKETEVHNG
jgi:hypothetical protein